MPGGGSAGAEWRGSSSTQISTSYALEQRHWLPVGPAVWVLISLQDHQPPETDKVVGL